MQTKVLVINSIGYAGGGAETILIKLNPYLLDKGYSLKTLASDLGADKEHFNDYAFKHINYTSPSKLLFMLFNPYSFFTLKKILKEYNPDLVHLHVMHQISPSVLFLLKKYPTIMTLHGPETFLSKLLIWCLAPSSFKDRFGTKNLNIAGKLAYFYFNHIQKFIYKLGLKNVDSFIVPSRYMQNVSKTDASPIVLLYYFVDLLNFHELKNNHNLLFVGRLEKGKGVEFLVKAIPLIINVFPQTTLTIVGDGCDKADLLNLAKKMQIEKHIQFVGWVEGKDIEAYYEKASIVVVPSIWSEAFGIVILEAMSAGRPVIGTNVGAIPEVIDDGVNGYLVEPRNSEQIAEKVIKLFSEEDLLKELGRNARKKAENFTIEKHVEGLTKIYEELINRYKSMQNLSK